MDRRWIHGALFTPQYICGVRSFMNFVRERFTEAEKILCPCQQCMNNQSLQQNEVERHLLLNGMSSTYTRWIDHGEDSNIHVLEQLAVVEDANVDSSVPEHTNDCGLDGMLGELIRSEQHGNEARPEDGNENVASQFKQLIEDAKHPPLTEYELERMRHCLLNDAKMQQLGLPVLGCLFANTMISPEIEQQKEKENSDSEYDGEDQPTSNGHLSDDGLEPEELGCTLASLSYKKKKTTSKVTKIGAQKAKPKMQPGVLTRAQKNCLADVTTVTNEAEICNQAPEQVDAGEQNGCLTGDENMQTEQNPVEHTPNGAMTHVNENGQTEGANVPEDDQFDEDWMRGPNIGRELVQMTRSKKGKLPLVIEPGKKRPNSLMIAAKFATECNIAVRNHVPIFPHWKEYKKHPTMIRAYIERVGTKFNTDVKAAPIKKACVAMMKKAIRQQRYKLKKRYFDALPLHLVPKTSPVTSTTDEQWDKLVEHWKNEQKMVTCEKNRENRNKVQFHQTTGSRSYEMQIVNLADKYKNEPPNALELFKEMHYSKKKGFAPSVQSLIVEMEEKLNEPVDDGVEPKDVTDVVSEALVQKTKKNRFLVNVGLRSKGSVNVERDLVEELEVEKQTSSDLREVIKTQQQQMEGMMKKFQESETTRAKQEEEAKKRQADTDKLIRNLMSMIQGCQATQ